jgi:phosphoglycolate phosphatase
LQLFLLGVLWLHDHLYEGSNITINKFVELGKKVYLLTNNNQITSKGMAEKCEKFGFNLGLDSMIAAAPATARYMKEIGFEKKVYVIGGKVLHEELNAIGIKTIGEGAECMTHDSLTNQVKYELSQMDKEVGAVICSFDPHFSFPKIFKAINYLRNPDVDFIATNDDENVDFPSFRFPDTGPIKAALENGSGRKALVIGKPSTLVFEVMLKQEAFRERKRFLMIGDRLNTDILFGNRNGFQTLLVGTGVHSLANVQDVFGKIEKGEAGKEDDLLIPDFYVSALKDLF